MKQSLILSIVAGISLAWGPGRLLAADLGSLKDAAPIEAPAPTWSGLYFGGSAGYGHNDSDNNYYDSTGASSSISESADGGLVSLVFGFDRQIHDRFVVGAFADIDWSDFDRGDDDINNGLTISRSWAIGARAGVLVNSRTLLFATAGFTQAHFRNDGWWDIETFGPTLPGKRSNNFNGYFLGAGLEVMLGSNFFARAELRYADYGEKTTNAGSFAGVDYVDAEDPEIITGRIGIVYKLGRHDHIAAEGSLKDGVGEADHSYKVVTINGIDVSKDAWWIYSLNVFALNGDFSRDGLVFRTLGLRGDYDYEDTSLPGSTFNAEDNSLDVMLGYQKVFSGFSATAYVGYEIRDIDIDPSDPTNKLRGTEDGVKFAFDLETEASAPFYFALDSSYSTAFDSYYGEVRAGLNAGKFIVGPEASIFDEEGDRSERVGAFAKIPFMFSPTMAAEFTVNGGYQFVDEGSGTGARGGEGGYAGSSLKVAF